MNNLKEKVKQNEIIKKQQQQEEQTQSKAKKSLFSSFFQRIQSPRKLSSKVIQNMVMNTKQRLSFQNDNEQITAGQAVQNQVSASNLNQSRQNRGQKVSISNNKQSIVDLIFQNKFIINSSQANNLYQKQDSNDKSSIIYSNQHSINNHNQVNISMGQSQNNTNMSQNINKNQTNVEKYTKMLVEKQFNQDKTQNIFCSYDKQKVDKYVRYLKEATQFSKQQKQKNENQQAKLLTVAGKKLRSISVQKKVKEFVHRLIILKLQKFHKFQNLSFFLTKQQIELVNDKAFERQIIQPKEKVKHVLHKIFCDNFIPVLNPGPCLTNLIALFALYSPNLEQQYQITELRYLELIFLVKFFQVLSLAHTLDESFNLSRKHFAISYYGV
ncbi:hypothetical protein PPERSA_04728 [Pseudocohnilembus persalinus]|uniref:Uncharacterized protein n=1 Tax=Pseudocohnilembus persalinus TaxID=266149 RepID=A0A0V0R4M5_PSEPJ|nr:hypothetical protein PPERSA_04728 [Pseudocohnilembus persalinus]|eukprot:KRX09422.1 hypothetical protein PPERSA_04728 [Pseudocohnilembus persalinus]